MLECGHQIGRLVAGTASAGQGAVAAKPGRAPDLPQLQHGQDLVTDEMGWMHAQARPADLRQEPGIVKGR